MLLRSSSTPILNSWIPQNYSNINSSPNNTNELLLSPSKTSSMSARSTSSAASSPSKTDLKDPPWTKTTRLQRLFSTSSLDDGDDNGGGGGYHGGGHGGGFGCNDDNSSSNNGHDKIEAYYQKMIKANPGDPLLLGNYAKFLKEVNYYMIIWFIHPCSDVLSYR